MLELNNAQFIGHVLLHPFEGFEDLRWKKKGSMLASIIIVLFFFISSIIYVRAYGFQFRSTYDKIFNVVPYLFQSIIIFLVWVVANWGMCTLNSGEGSMRKIFIFTAYSLVPYVSCQLLATLLSNVMVQEEEIFLTAITIIGYAWSGLLVITSQKAVHQFSLGKTIALIFLTLLAMLMILFLLILLLTLFQQVIIFVMSIYTEISYRIKV
jgi:hypothetical protein